MFNIKHSTLHIISFLILYSLGLKAQDPVFSQFNASPLYLNPAFAGVGEGMTIYAHHRNQWANINNGFQTYAVGWCSREPKLGGGIGMTLLRDVSPGGIIVANQVNLQYAYNIVDPNETFSIHTGLQAGYGAKRLNWNGLVFSDQLDPVLGIQFPTAAAAPVVGKSSYWDFAAGIIARFGIPFKGNIADNELGFSVQHLNRPVESLQAIGSRLPMRWTVHYLTTFPIVQFGALRKYYLYLTPMARYENQRNLMVTTFGLSAATSNLAFGLMYQNKTLPLIGRHTNALILTAGFRWNVDNPIQLGISYDVNTSGLNTITGGVYEISLNYTIRKARIIGEARNNNPLKCYRFMNKSYFR